MPSPLTIWHVDGERGFRGGERQLLYLACALRARGHRNVIVCRAGEELEARAKLLGFETRTLPFLIEWDPVSALMLNRWAAEGLVHAHTGHAVALAALARRPFVAHRRVDFSSSTFKYRRAARVVAVSRAIAEVMEKDGYTDVSVVPDAIPVTRDECGWISEPPNLFAPGLPTERSVNRASLASEFNIDAGGPWVGNLAALVPHKDHETLIAAALLVLMKRPDARFIIAGKGPEEERLLGQIKRLGLLGKVLLIGHREADHVLKAVDFFCLSSWGEGMGSVLLEAMANGLPVAATSAGGIPEVVDDQETGLLAPPRDAEALASALLRLIEDKALARRLAAEARRRLPKFGLERMAKEMEKIYDAAR